MVPVKISVHYKLWMMNWKRVSPSSPHACQFSMLRSAVSLPMGGPTDVTIVEFSSYGPIWCHYNNIHSSIEGNFTLVRLQGALVPFYVFWILSCKEICVQARWWVSSALLTHGMPWLLFHQLYFGNLYSKTVYNFYEQINEEGHPPHKAFWHLYLGVDGQQWYPLCNCIYL